MIINNLYYLVKPLLPWRLRTALRRARAARMRRVYGDSWPIDAKAGATPPNWPGWPNGKRFAIVLTHDVEGARGMNRVQRLADLEARYGFRSSFNFVPEGEYRVPDSLRDALDQAGFEVGVHGLAHDGKLYRSKREFAANAIRINDYLRKWNASGFRSPFMQHKLGWLHELDVEYDSSTFDTDPFEPEPDAAATIFPFWVPDGKGGGYVELPYTLIQDYNLFTILREPDSDIWKQKLDWIAAQGGMALLNTHPDYMCFNGESARDEFPVERYEEFLSYVHRQYEGDCWVATPREVARYYCAALPVCARNTRRKICMLTYSDYESDNRVRRYAETLARRGDKVDVIALAGGSAPQGVEAINGVTAYRFQGRNRDEKHKWTYLWRLLRFFSLSSVLLTRNHGRVRYDLIHIHNVPDFLVFAAWYPKWTAAKLILDIHDIVPELFANKFGASSSALYVWLLKKIEKISAAFVDHVIVSNDLWRQRLVSRSVAEDKCTVFLNHVDPAIFYRHPRTRLDERIVVLFPGSFQWHQGLDIAIEAFARVRQKISNAEFHLYGGGNLEADLVRLVERLGLNGSVRFCGSVKLDMIAGIIANADLGVVPKRADSFGNEAYSTKIMEFMSQGLPVVAARTKIDSFYFDDTEVRFFTPGDSHAMADAMMEVIERADLRETLVSAGYRYVERYGWDVREKDYLTLVDTLSTEVFSSALTESNVPG